MADLIGKTIGKYRVVAKLGRGGMAEVYKAYQPGLERYVAIKVMHSYLSEDQEFVGRFEREALATGKLRHPNIVQAVDFDQEANIYFMVMDFIDGPTLKTEMRARRKAGKPLGLKEIARIYGALCDAIDYAHSRQMIHRDLKPANVMLNSDGEVMLTDFGIARIMDATQHTATGSMAGTPAYMSPEQGQGLKVDERSDIYSLGIMLYEMVVGQVPYEADTPIAVVMKHIQEVLSLPSKVNPDVPKSVEQVIVTAMSKNSDDRYQTAGAMAIALREAVGLSPADTLRRNPLTVVAPPAKLDELDPTTNSFTAVGTAVLTTPDEGTIVSDSSIMGDNTQATVLDTPPPKRGISIGMVVGVIALLLAVGLGDILRL